MNAIVLDCLGSANNARQEDEIEKKRPSQEKKI